MRETYGLMNASKESQHAGSKSAEDFCVGSGFDKFGANILKKSSVFANVSGVSDFTIFRSSFPKEQPSVARRLFSKQIRYI